MLHPSRDVPFYLHVSVYVLLEEEGDSAYLKFGGEGGVYVFSLHVHAASESQPVIWVTTHKAVTFILIKPV